MIKVAQKQLNVHQLWLLIMFLTLTTYALGKLGFSGVWVMLILLSTAAIKATIIMRDFMELRGVSKLWQWMMYGWLGFVCLAISISYFVS